MRAFRTDGGGIEDEGDWDELIDWFITTYDKWSQVAWDLLPRFAPMPPPLAGALERP